MSGRVLGLDLGEARIGVAISDPERRMAVAVGTVSVGRPPGELQALAAIVAEEQAVLVVLGYPLSLDGTAGAAAAKAESFAEVLRTWLGIPVQLQDERLSTVQAQKSLTDAGASSRQARKVIDSHAAVVILQAWLDKQDRAS
jgi:putative Holliday junction resolvase